MSRKDSVSRAFLEHFRCPVDCAQFLLEDRAELSQSSGYFEFGTGRKCYGRSTVPGSSDASAKLPDLVEHVRYEGASCVLPFDPTEVAESLRSECYVVPAGAAPWRRIARKLYYTLRPVLPVNLRKHLQAGWLQGWGKVAFPAWPVDRSVDEMFETLMRLLLVKNHEEPSSDKRIPFIWFWPEGKASCAIMTHDVETEAGLRFSAQLMDIDDGFEVKSSFQLIPDARYVVSDETLATMRRRGFEVNVHDLKHDGHLFDKYNSFQDAARQINKFGLRFGSKGFRSAILYRNQAWLHHLNFSYDMSVPNVGHLDPQHGGCCTVMPYFVDQILELPVTAIQDYTLFNILGTYSTDLWELQMEQITKHHGLASFIIHPDYLATHAAVNVYKRLLKLLAHMRETQRLWVALPGEVDKWWRQRSSMRLQQDGTVWTIKGEGAHRARIAYATMREGELRYDFS